MDGGLGERVTEGFSLSLQTEDLRPRKSLGMQGSQSTEEAGLDQAGPGGFSIFPPFPSTTSMNQRVCSQDLGPSWGFLSSVILSPTWLEKSLSRKHSSAAVGGGVGRGKAGRHVPTPCPITLLSSLISPSLMEPKGLKLLTQVTCCGEEDTSDKKEKETKLQPRHTHGLDPPQLPLGPRFKEGHWGWGWGQQVRPQGSGRPGPVDSKRDTPLSSLTLMALLFPLNPPCLHNCYQGSPREQGPSLATAGLMAWQGNWGKGGEGKSRGLCGAQRSSRVDLKAGLRQAAPSLRGCSLA